MNLFNRIVVDTVLKYTAIKVIPNGRDCILNIGGSFSK